MFTTLNLTRIPRGAPVDLLAYPFFQNVFNLIIFRKAPQKKRATTIQ